MGFEIPSIFCKKIIMKGISHENNPFLILVQNWYKSALIVDHGLKACTHTPIFTGLVSESTL